jgi:putative DNA primase/helicase
MVKTKPVNQERPSAANGEWRERYVLRGTRNQVDARSPANLMLCFREHPLFKNAFAFNEMSSDLELARDIPGVGAAGDHLDLAKRQLLTVLVEQQEGLLANSRLIDNTVFVLAKENPTNAVKRSLLSLKWDGSPRLSTWLADALGVAGTPARIATAGPRLMISAVARILEPGIGIDSLWVMQATEPEPIHQALEILFGEWYYRWCDPHLFHDHTIEEVLGKWCVNIMDIDQWRPQFFNRLKSLARRLSDMAPTKLMGYSSTIKRTSFYVSVSNKFPDQQIIKAANGTDPFYELIPCVKINLHTVRDWRNQLLAEAVNLYQRKRTHLRAGWRLMVVKDADLEKVAEFVSGKAEVTLREVVEGMGKQYQSGPGSTNFRYGKLLRLLNMHPIRLNPWEPEAKIVFRLVQ